MTASVVAAIGLAPTELANGDNACDTWKVKTAVSLPDDLYDRAERVARRLAMTRCGLFGAALKEYVARHTEDDVTEAMKAALLEVDDRTDHFDRAASVRVLERDICSLGHLARVFRCHLLHMDLRSRLWTRAS